MKTMNLPALRTKIFDYFSVSELQNLCFDLGVRYENLPGSTLEDKARELVDYCSRRGHLPALLERCMNLRPNKSWRGIVDFTQQLAPQIREEKLAFLCRVYIKLDGSILQQCSPEDMASIMDLGQRETIRIAQFLKQKSLIEFHTWYTGIRITHQGLVKVEHDIIEAGFLLEDFPSDIVAKIRKVQQIRSDFLLHLYRKSNGSPFEPVSRIEIANSLGLDDYQLVRQGIPQFLKNEGLLSFGGVPNVRITEVGIERVEAMTTKDN